MTVDLCVHCGFYSRRPIGVEPAALRDRLAPFGVTRIYFGRLEALWFENPHDANRLGESQPLPEGMVHVPALDPSIVTWRDELDRLASRGPVPVVRLYPNYGGYAAADADPVLAELARRKIVAQFVVRIDDPRRQHRLAQVADVPTGAVREAAARHPALRVLLSGAQTAALNVLGKELPATPNLWADTSQADGVEAVLGLMKSAWRDRLVFGSHAPLFIPEAAFSRVVLDLGDDSAERVLAGNAGQLLT